MEWDDRDDGDEVWRGVPDELLTGDERNRRSRKVDAALDAMRRELGIPTEDEQRVRDIQRELRERRKRTRALQTAGTRQQPHTSRPAVPRRRPHRAGWLSRIVAAFTSTRRTKTRQRPTPRQYTRKGTKGKGRRRERR